MAPSLPAWFERPDTVFMIAEVGVNHNGDCARALDMVDVAAQAGADAVKFQTFKASALVTSNADKAAYQQRNDGTDTTQSEMLAALELADEDWQRIKARCDETGVAFLSTPFDEGSADFLQGLGVDAFKISSGDLTHLPMLRHIARKGLPMVISTGMADLADTQAAVDAIEGAGDPPLAILHCVSDYPADPASANLRALQTLAAAFGRPVGWSDHTLGAATSLASVALGARVIEKHFTLDKALPGPDHAASLEPDELIRYIADIRTVEAALGDGRKRPTPAERDTARVARRSVVTLRDIAEGETLTPDNCGARRPGTGLPPLWLDRVIGRRAARALPAGAVLGLADLDLA